MTSPHKDAHTRKGLMNPAFKYVNSADTDLAKRFASIRRQLAKDASALKAGDEVAFLGGGFSRAYSIYTVERTTPTQIIAASRRFRRKDGASVEKSSGYSRGRIYPVPNYPRCVAGSTGSRAKTWKCRFCVR